MRCCNKHSGLKGGTIALPGIAKQLKITAGTEAAGFLMKPSFFTHENMIRIAANRNLSDNAVIGIAEDIRKVLGRRSIQLGLASALFEKNHKMDHLFEVKTKQMFGKKDKKLVKCQ